MVDYITLTLIEIITFISAGYHMDDQVIVPSNVSRKHETRLTENTKKYFILKNKVRRSRFLTAALIQQIIAFVILLTNAAVIVFLGQTSDYSLAKHINLYFIGIDLLSVVVIGVYYKLKVKSARKIQKGEE